MRGKSGPAWGQIRAGDGVRSRNKPSGNFARTSLSISTVGTDVWVHGMTQDQCDDPDRPHRTAGEVAGPTGMGSVPQATGSGSAISHLGTLRASGTGCRQLDTNTAVKRELAVSALNDTASGTGFSAANRTRKRQ